jgi:lipid-A-disaccharide synthase
VAPPTLLVSAGDPSGIAYAAELAHRLRERGASELFGLGGASMAEAGVELLANGSELAVVGLTEALRKIPRALALLGQLEAEAVRRGPSAAILIDFPDFNLRLARRLSRHRIPVVYLIAPQVWAWRPRRLEILREAVSLLLVIFPFEKEFFTRHGIATVEFIGHPLADRTPVQVSREAFARRHGLQPAAPILGLLPGSRVSEVRHHLGILLKAVEILRASGHRTLQPVVAAAPGLHAEEFHAATRAGVPVLQGMTEQVLAVADCAVVSSGTATVEAALAGCPLVAVYRVSATSAWLLRRMVRVPYYSMVNLLLGRPVVPELIQEAFTAPAVAGAIARLLDESALREAIRKEFRLLRAQLKNPTGSSALDRAAELILEHGGRPATTASVLLS